LFTFIFTFLATPPHLLGRRSFCTKEVKATKTTRLENKARRKAAPFLFQDVTGFKNLSRLEKRGK